MRLSETPGSLSPDSLCKRSNLSARLTVPPTWNEEDKPELIRAPPHCAARVPCGKEREINHFERTKKGEEGKDKGEKVTRAAILRRALCTCWEVWGLHPPMHPNPPP
jgi:hypothetical protein